MADENKMRKAILTKAPPKLFIQFMRFDFDRWVEYAASNVL